MFTESEIDLISHLLSSANVSNWRFFPLNNCYVVTTQGDIFSVCKIQHTKAGTISKQFDINQIKGSTDRYGYMTVKVSINGRKKHFKVHRMVALTFLPNPDSKPTVNHRNGVKKDNRLVNLEWATNKENNIHAIETNLNVTKKLGHHKNAKIKPWDYAPIHFMIKHCGSGRLQLAERFSVSRQTIDNVYNAVNRLVNQCNYSARKSD
jgi:hypothetical protein